MPLIAVSVARNPVRDGVIVAAKVGSWLNGIKLGKANGGVYSKFRYLQFNNFAISTLFRA
jgi:hypothetical protein